MTSPKPSWAVPSLGPDDYARWRASTLGRITERLERQLICDLAGEIRGQHILDVGCGDGEFALDLWKRGGTVVGIDASRTMIEAARTRAREHGSSVVFGVATAEHLPFPEGRFDLVTAITILCFVDDAAPILAEIRRVLRPGGRLVIGELGRWSLWAAGRRIRGWFGSPLWRRGRFRTAGELRALAIQAGLVAGPVRGAIFYPRCSLTARLLNPCDRLLGRFITIGAAFLALSATKPASEANA